MFELKTFDEIGADQWDKFVLSANNGSIHQLSNWKSLQEATPTRGLVLGWAALEDGEIKAASLLTRMKTGFFNTEWFYAGRGPVSTNRKATEFLIEQITEKLKLETPAIFWRYDPYLLSSEKPLDSGIPAQASYHPTDSIVIDLTLGVDELWRQVKSKKRRYDIRHGQDVLKLHKTPASKVTSKQLDSFYYLLEAAAKRDNFRLHPKNYYRDFLKHLSNYATLWIVEFESKPVAASITTLCNGTGIYYFAALTDDKAARKYTPAHFLLWEIIKYMSTSNAKQLDLLGIAPENASANHPYAGITKFKSSFGGQAVHYHLGREIGLRPAWHKLYCLAKRLKG